MGCHLTVRSVRYSASVIVRPPQIGDVQNQVPRGTPQHVPAHLPQLRWLPAQLGRVRTLRTAHGQRLIFTELERCIWDQLAQLTSSQRPAAQLAQLAQLTCSQLGAPDRGGAVFRRAHGAAGGSHRAGLRSQPGHGPDGVPDHRGPGQGAADLLIRHALHLARRALAAGCDRDVADRPSAHKTDQRPRAHRAAGRPGRRLDADRVRPLLDRRPPRDAGPPARQANPRPAGVPAL